MNTIHLTFCLLLLMVPRTTAGDARGRNLGTGR
jgi:hypothetical protein